MNIYGPQIPYKRDWSIFLHLKACGMMSEGVLERISLCLDLSFASFDLESCTEELIKNERENRSIEDRIQDQTRIARDRSWQHVSAKNPTSSGARRDESIHGIKIQRPILIGHLDYWHESYENPEKKSFFPDLRKESEKEMISRVTLFDTSDGATSKEMIEQYAEFLVNRRDQVAAFKAFLLRKELSVINAYKEKHCSFFESEGIERDSSQCTQAWKFSVLGRLEARLKKLIDRFTVWSFSGSSYDMVLILPSLMTAKCLQKFKAFILRKGSQVNQLSYDSGLRFCDISKLLSPGTSLQKLASAVGLKTRKMLMPYALIDEDLRFLSMPSLPTEPEAYFSELNQKQPTREEIDGAIKDFKELGCRNVKDYLQYYLRIDVLLLHSSLQLYLAKLASITGCHVLDADRYTLSSFSDICAQHQLMLDKRPAFFSVNATRAYSLLRRSMTGGITQVIRNCVNWKECTGERDSLANEHLTDVPNEELEMDEHEAERERKHLRWVHYLDIASLYASSGK